MESPLDFQSLPPDKLYFSIGEVGEILKVNSSLIRYWEREFTEIKPRKNRKGDRSYTKADILLLHKIYILVKEKGYTLEGAKKALKETPEADKNPDILERLKKIQKELQIINNYLEDLGQKNNS